MCSTSVVMQLHSNREVEQRSKTLCIKPVCIKNMCTKLRAVNLCRAVLKRVDSQQSCLQKQLRAAKLCAVKTACSKNCMQQNCVQQCVHGVNSAQLNATQTSCSEGSFCVQIPSLSLYLPGTPPAGQREASLPNRAFKNSCPYLPLWP